MATDKANERFIDLFLLKEGILTKILPQPELRNSGLISY
jgi:hypothetical protein